MKKLLVWVLVLVLLTPCLAFAEGGGKVIVYRQEGDTIVFDIAHAETIVNMTVDRADASRYVDMPEAGLTFHHFGFMSRDTAQDASILYYFTNPRGLSASFYAPQPGHVREEQTSGQKAIINGMDASVSISHMSYESQVLMTMLNAWVQVSDDDMVYCTLSYKGDSQNDLLLMLKHLAAGRKAEFDGFTLEADEHFYVLGLAPNAARLSVRFFLQDSFGDFADHLLEHHERLRIVKPAFDQRVSLSFWYLLNETVNQKSRDKTPSPLLWPPGVGEGVCVGWWVGW